MSAVVVALPVGSANWPWSVALASTVVVVLVARAPLVRLMLPTSAGEVGG